MLQMGMLFPGDTALWLSIHKYKHDWQELISYPSRVLSSPPVFMTFVFLIIAGICFFVLIVYLYFLSLFLSHCLSVCLFVLFDDLFILTFVSTVYCFTYIRGRRGRYRMVVRLKTTYVISAYHFRLSISNPAQDDVYSIQPCVIKLNTEMCIWCLEAMDKLNTDIYISFMEAMNKLNTEVCIWCIESLNKLNTEMYIWCLEATNKLNSEMYKINTEMYIWCREAMNILNTEMCIWCI
jgi:hypothetical protein